MWLALSKAKAKATTLAINKTDWAQSCPYLSKIIISTDAWFRSGVWEKHIQWHMQRNKFVYWPSPQDYNEAVQTPFSSFTDSGLKNAVVEATPLGLPRCVTGNFASVYCLANNDRKIALRCFLHDVPDQEHRYREISDFIMNDDLPYTVPFEFIKQGIKVRGEWYPVLKMHWVEGLSLTQFVEQNLQNSQSLNLLASYFKQMTIELHRAGIAHGDLQHDNILISDHELRLVDYDGMFVPALADLKANELGHRNYQHPRRDTDLFKASLDNFSAWVIYASLKILAIDPSLWSSLQGGDDCLLLRYADLSENAESDRLKLLLHHQDARIQNFACKIQRFLTLPPDEIPPVDEEAVGRALTLVPKKTELSNADQVKPLANAPAPFASAAALLDKSQSHKAIVISSPQLRLAPVSGWSPQAEVLKHISVQLDPDEIISWSSKQRRDSRQAWDIITALAALVLVTFCLTCVGNFALLILMGILPGWIQFRSKMYDDTDSMYLLTNKRVVLIKGGGLETIPFDDILTVEEHSTGASIVLISSATNSISVKNVRSMSLDNSDTSTLFKSLPQTVSRRRF